MGANVWKRRIVSLGEEGELVTLIESHKRPNPEQVKQIKILDHLWHYPYCHGVIRVKKITKNKQALFCEGCGWRILIPEKIKIVEELRMYIGFIERIKDFGELKNIINKLREGSEF